MATRIGSALRRAREAKGWTLRELEDRAGMSASQISQVENGIREDPAFSTIVRLARALGLSLDRLAGLPNAGPVVQEHSSRTLVELERLRTEAAKSLQRLERIIGEVRKS